MDDDLDTGITLRPDRWARAIQDAMPALIPLGIIGALRAQLLESRKGVPASKYI